MSKKYKGKSCPHCARPEASVTADHVFAREFFSVEKRDGLPVVPACERCNNEKSKLDHYLVVRPNQMVPVAASRFWANSRGRSARCPQPTRRRCMQRGRSAEGPALQ